MRKWLVTGCVFGGGVTEPNAVAESPAMEEAYEMGITKYEVEFRVGAQEYNYDIDMTTGDIYEFDSEMDD